MIQQEESCTEETSPRLLRFGEGYAEQKLDSLQAE